MARPSKSSKTGKGRKDGRGVSSRFIMTVHPCDDTIRSGSIDDHCGSAGLPSSITQSITRSSDAKIGVDTQHRLAPLYPPLNARHHPLALSDFPPWSRQRLISIAKRLHHSTLQRREDHLQGNLDSVCDPPRMTKLC